MNAELSPKAFWGAVAALVLVGGGIAFGLIRRSDPAAQGPQPYRPFDPSKHANEMAPPSPFANHSASKDTAKH